MTAEKIYIEKNSIKFYKQNTVLKSEENESMAEKNMEKNNV